MNNWRDALAGGGLVLAHRGARSIAPENTLAAAAAAYAVGAHGWELDTAATSDGRLVVIHDTTLERTSNAAKVYPDRSPWRVEDFSAAELAALDFGSWFLKKDPFGQILAGAVPERELSSFAGTTVPSLAEALAFSRERDWLVNIELKNLSRRPQGPDPVEALIFLLDEMEMDPLVLISSFNRNYLVRLHKQRPNLALGVLSQWQLPNARRAAAALSAISYHPRADRIGPRGIAKLKEAGLGILPWTVNQPGRAATLLKWGVSGFFTDFPQNFSNK